MIRLFFLTGALLALFAGPAKAAETINQFDVRAVIDKNGEVTIEETINVTVENVQIRHGIYRDIPTIYNDGSGGKVRTGFSIKAVERNGYKEPYHTEQLSNGVRIYFGDKNIFVSPGIHTYHLRYRVSNVMGFFPDHDEFFWNVTGNAWIFPIARARITVELPPEARVLKVIGYTGSQGQKGVNYRASFHNNIFEASTTAMLAANQGLTVAGAFSKGVVRPLTFWGSVKAFIESDRGLAVFLGSVSLTLLFYAFAWWFTGRDAPLAPIIPRFDIMNGVSPDLLRYIYKQKYDDKVLSCLIVNAAVDKKAVITDSENEIEIKRTASTSALTPVEQTVFSELFLNGRQLVIPRRKLFASSRDRTKREDLAHQIMRAKTSHQSMFTMGMAGPGYGADLIEKSTYAVHYAKGLFTNFFASDPDEYFSTPGFAGLGRIVILFLSIAANFYVAAQGDYIVATVIFQILVFWAFFQPMKKYSPEGQEIYEYAKGLRLYLSVAEKARLNALFPKDMTPDIFEKFLPYALALDVENKWSNHFAKVMRESGQVYTDDGGWYYGRRHGIENIGSVLGSMSSSISSAGSPPGSSSGFGSGSGSGGGGGGGGGGGW